jgi:hypothetical protein
MAVTECNYFDNGGGGNAFSVPEMKTVAGGGYAYVSASNVSKVILFIPELPEISFWDISGIGDNYVLPKNAVTPITNPTTAQVNQSVTYSNGTITIHSESSAQRDVWVTYC